MRWIYWPFALSALWLSCSRTPDDLREWKPSDHQHTANPNAGQVNTSADSGRAGAAKMLGVDDVVLATWKQKCTVCHGMIGRGDGPQGAMLKVRNLADPAWQASVSDEQIANVIKNGKGAMPATNIPDKTIKGLVRLVRLMNPQRRKGDAGEAAADGSARRVGPADGGTRPTRRRDAAAEQRGRAN